MIDFNELVNELREYSEYCLRYGHESRAQELLKEAADTIETLSAKLQAANIEQSTANCDGGWIADRPPTKEECGEWGRSFNVTVKANGLKTMSMEFVYETVRGKEVGRWKWLGRLSPWEVIAWQPLPEPYYEP